jgi:hypothetical protein
MGSILRVRIQGSWPPCQSLVIHPTHAAHAAARHGRRARILLRPLGKRAVNVEPRALYVARALLLDAENAGEMR